MWIQSSFLSKHRSVDVEALRSCQSLRCPSEKGPSGVCLCLCLCVCVHPYSQLEAMGARHMRASTHAHGVDLKLVYQAGPTADKDAEGEDMSALHAVQDAALMQTPVETSLAPGGVDNVREAGDAAPASMESSSATVEAAAGTQAVPSVVYIYMYMYLSLSLSLPIGIWLRFFVS